MFQEHLRRGDVHSARLHDPKRDDPNGCPVDFLSTVSNPLERSRFDEILS
jgi:hypothetical protein